MKRFLQLLRPKAPPPESARRVEAWYAQYGEAVYYRCLTLLRDEACAWDTTQDVFLRAFRASESFRGDSSPLTWLFAITDRCCFTQLRRRAREQRTFTAELPEPAPKEPGRDQETTAHESALIAAILGHFPEEVQRLAVLRFVDGLELDEIAAQLGWSRRTVQRQLERFLIGARKRLYNLAPTPPPSRQA